MSKHEYHLAWSNRVLAAFEKKYPDASKQINDFLDVKRIDVLRMLSGDQARWRLYKKLVKLQSALLLSKSMIAKYRAQFRPSR